MAMKQVDTEEVLGDMIEIIATRVFPAIESGVGTMPISADARLWWVNHYARTFFFAHVVLEQVWADDEAQVLLKAKELGQEATAAATLAGHTQVEVTDAKAASMKVDCGIWRSSAAGTIRLSYKWC